MHFHIINYFIWTGNSALFSVGSVSVKWDALLLIIGFLICRHVLFYIFEKENKPSQEAAKLSIYLVIVAIIGARLGDALFNGPQSAGTNFLSFLLPFGFEPDFHLLARKQFSIHGATLAILLFLWFYRGKNKFNNYLQILDRVVIAAALSGVFILMGSFLSSELAGKPTDSSSGVIFIKPVLQGLLKVPCCIMRSPEGKNPLENVVVAKDPASIKKKSSQQSIIFYLFFRAGASEQLVNEFLIGDVKTYLYDMAPYVQESGKEPLKYRIFLEKDGTYIARITTLGIARYPVQIMEATFCLILFAFLFVNWRSHKGRSSPPGRLFGYFMLAFWSLHFALGFLKENQVTVEIGLNILFLLAGITALVVSIRKNSVIKH